MYGNNSFKGNLQNYTVKIDPDDFDGIGINLNLKSTLKPYRPQDGIIKAGDDYFAWLSAVPNGVVSGDLVVNGKSTKLSGSGYHDHNWGNTPLQYLFDDWVWFRGEIEDKTIVAAVLYMTDKRGGYDVPILYIADSSKVHVNKFGEDGLRTSGDKNEFEWWYLDAKLDDGSVLVTYFWKVHFIGDQYFIGFNYRDKDGNDFFKLKYFRSRDVSFSSDSCDVCLLYTSPSPRDGLLSRMPSSA